jgi:hypothetical protein
VFERGKTILMTRNAFPAYFLLLASSSLVSAASRAAKAEDASFEKTVEPFLAKNCALCHNAKIKTADVNLEGYRDAGAALRDRDVWERVLAKLETGQMPPAGSQKPNPEDVRAVEHWISSSLARLDRNTRPDPGRVTAHRLNRFEYNNTIRDLLGIDFHPADDFPADDAGYGFDNIGDVLSLSPVLMEKYLTAAEQIAKRAIFGDPILKPTQERYQSEAAKYVDPAGAFETQHHFPVTAQYEIHSSLAGKRPMDGESPLKEALWLDGKQIKITDVPVDRTKPRQFDVRLSVSEGTHHLRAAILRDGPPNRDTFVEYIEVRGPFQQKPAGSPESAKRIFVCGEHTLDCAHRILAPLAHRAYRGPVSGQEINGLVHFVSMAQKEGDGFEQGIQLAIEAMLVSPHFLFRIEHDSKPTDPSAVHQIGDVELASRLSYFLWSSMPDDELLAAAETKTLRRPGVLEAQVRRMLADPKSIALVDNFGGQWLEIRNLDTIKPDPERFPAFDSELRQAMRQETRLFFQAIIRDDRSILDFIDGKFTYLNERLARHYGIPGVVGPEFRRVDLTTDQRSGVLTQASVLTVSSYPTRTSPILRGKWILENILNAPPPPPPPGVANLNESAVGTTASLRQQLEQHRSDPSCAVCHAKMDPLGFGLENYDAIGAWRTMDSKFPVDATGTMPGGKSFETPAGLKAILKADSAAFSQCLTEKLLTYALGRGLETYDKRAVKSIVADLPAGGYKFSQLILDIVNSVPFEMRRGDGKKI